MMKWLMSTACHVGVPAALRRHWGMTELVLKERTFTQRDQAQPDVWRPHAVDGARIWDSPRREHDHKHEPLPRIAPMRAFAEVQRRQTRVRQHRVRIGIRRLLNVDGQQRMEKGTNSTVLFAAFQIRYRLLE